MRLILALFVLLSATNTLFASNEDTLNTAEQTSQISTFSPKSVVIFDLSVLKAYESFSSNNNNASEFKTEAKSTGLSTRFAALFDVSPSVPTFTIGLGLTNINYFRKGFIAKSTVSSTFSFLDFMGGVKYTTGSWINHFYGSYGFALSSKTKVELDNIGEVTFNYTSMSKYEIGGVFLNTSPNSKHSWGLKSSLALLNGEIDFEIIKSKVQVIIPSIGLVYGYLI